MTEPKLVRCGHCGKHCRRRFSPEKEGVPLIYSRTLLKDELVPSCSEDCHRILQMRLGDDKAKRIKR